MKRLSTGVLVALMVAGLGLDAVAAPAANVSHGKLGHQAIAQATPEASASPTATPETTATPATTAPPPAQAPTPNLPPANFGSPPSGQIPILFNDHHVYSKPDTLKQGRVLAALVRGGTILIPLRSMFEQMGASVSYDPASKTVDVSKAGADVKVTVGKPEVNINGESRPLDVPPEIYQGTVLVPIRVISEGMGAYVQWVPSQRVVVVRYAPATPPPPPTPAPTVAPTVAPTPTPAPVVAPKNEYFVAGDYIFSPKVYNEFSPGNSGKSSYGVHGAAEFNVFNLPWMVEGDYRQFQYPHNTGAFGLGTPCNLPPPAGAQGDQGCVTTIGRTGQTFVPAFEAKNYDVDARLGLKVADPRIYIGVGYIWTSNNYGYPKENGVGFGAEKLPDLNHPLSVEGNIYYYPSIKGSFTDPSTGVGYSLQYNLLKYMAGLTYSIGKAGVYLEAGYLGESWNNKSNAPVNQTFNGPFAGLGIHF